MTSHARSSVAVDEDETGDDEDVDEEEEGADPGSVTVHSGAAGERER
jgi:hypothetical protein